MKAEPSAIEALRRARERTLAARSARIVLFIDYTWEMPPMPRRRRGGLMRPLTKLAKAAGKRLWKLATGNFDFRHQEAEGVLDLAGRRYMLDYGSYARLYADGKEWSGRSGRTLATLPPESNAVPTPLWLLDLLAGVTDAQDEGTGEVRGTACRHVAAKADVSQASRATPGGVAVPTLGRFEDLLALPLEVWLDGSHTRRLRFAAEDRVETLQLWDFGTALEDLDWTRLPTFRSPQEAACVAGDRTPSWKGALKRRIGRRRGRG